MNWKEKINCAIYFRKVKYWIKLMNEKVHRCTYIRNSHYDFNRNYNNKHKFIKPNSIEKDF